LADRSCEPLSGAAAESDYDRHVGSSETTVCICSGGELAGPVPLGHFSLGGRSHAWADAGDRFEVARDHLEAARIHQIRSKQINDGPDRTGNFVYGLINTIWAQSEELCARYGNPSDCLEEAEVCLTMRDTDDNEVRLCLNTVPGDSGGNRGTVQNSRMRR
jgi:hypothetical protein